jgi:hypothetical protein
MNPSKIISDEIIKNVWKKFGFHGNITVSKFMEEAIAQTKTQCKNEFLEMIEMTRAFRISNTFISIKHRKAIDFKQDLKQQVEKI